MALLARHFVLDMDRDRSRDFHGVCNDRSNKAVHRPQTNISRMRNSTLRKRPTRDLRNLLNLDPHAGPRPETLQAILGYSKALRIVDAPPIGKVRIVLN